MKSEGFPKHFSLRHWVEGPLEGMMDLSRDVEDYRSRLQTILALSTMVMASFFVLLCTFMIMDAWSIVSALLNSTLPSDTDMLLTLIALALLFMALSFSTALLTLHVWRYVRVMLKRLENVEELFGMSGDIEPEIEVEETDVEDSKKGPHTGLFNLLGASESFTKGLVQNMPQVSKQMKLVRTMLFIMPLYYLSMRFLLPLIFMGEVEAIPSNSIDIMLDILAIALSLLAILAGLFMIEAHRFMEVLYARMSFMESVNSASIPMIPEAVSSRESLVQYVKNSGKCYGGIKASTSGDGIIHHTSDECVVLAIEASEPLTVDLVKRFHERSRQAVKKACPEPSKGRFMILYTEESGLAEDIGEDVSDYILANPVIMGRGPGGGRSETVIQLIIEEEGAYGLFPFVE